MKHTEIKNYEHFTLALRNGYGFALACELSDNDPKYLTSIIKANKEIKNLCDSCLYEYKLTLLKLAEKCLYEGDFKTLAIVNDKMQNVLDLIFWASFGKLEYLTPLQVKGMLDVFSKKDLAVGFGVSVHELDKYIQENSKTSEYDSKFKGKKTDADALNYNISENARINAYNSYFISNKEDGIPL